MRPPTDDLGQLLGGVRVRMRGRRGVATWREQGQRVDLRRSITARVKQKWTSLLIIFVKM